MSKSKPKIAVIKAAKHNNPQLRKEMYDCVDAVMRSKTPAVGYAFVSFHEDGGFQVYWQTPPGFAAIDIGDMARVRILSKALQNFEPMD